MSGRPALLRCADSSSESSPKTLHDESVRSWPVRKIELGLVNVRSRSDWPRPSPKTKRRSCTKLHACAHTSISISKRALPPPFPLPLASKWSYEWPHPSDQLVEACRHSRITAENACVGTNASSTIDTISPYHPWYRHIPFSPWRNIDPAGFGFLEPRKFYRFLLK